jgi:hypothetical protein
MILKGKNTLAYSTKSLNTNGKKFYSTSRKYFCQNVFFLKPEAKANMLDGEALVPRHSDKRHSAK